MTYIEIIKNIREIKRIRIENVRFEFERIKIISC